MSQAFPISIDNVIDLLALEREPRYRAGMVSYKVRCPFCGGSKYYMNINTEKNTYNCFHCSGSKTGGGALDLYSRVALGYELIPGKKRNGGNGDLVFAKLADALNMPFPGACSAVPHNSGKRKRTETEFPERASDDKLDLAYSAIMRFRHFALSEEHRRKLQDRGLDNASIERNGYFSVCDFNWVKEYREEIDCYNKSGLHEAFNRYDSLKRMPVNQRIAGIIIANELLKAGIDPRGVPGFFKLSPGPEARGKGIWVFRLERGMLIPTRSREGRIVCLQARKDYGRLRYMTVSSKGLPEAVSSGISRTHFPLGNSPLSANSKVLLTEGPVKADVAVHLMGDNAFFIATHGVNCIGELPEIFKYLRQAGVTQLYSAHDMDKTTNPYVAKACKAIEGIAAEEGLAMSMLFWGKAYAEAKYLELSALCRYYGLETKDGQANVYESLTEAAAALSAMGIPHSVYFDRNGEEVKKYWSGISKGIDDYLYQRN